MKIFSKKITVYIFVGLLVFCSTSINYYRSAHAMEWVGGALAFEEALKWTLAVLGITATAGMTDAYWDQYGDEFVDYAIENGATQQEVTEWQMKLCQGILDKASSVWISFKSWAKSLLGESSGGNSSGLVSISDVADYFGFNESLLSDYSSYYYSCGHYFTNGNGYSYVDLYTTPSYADFNGINISTHCNVNYYHLGFGVEPKKKLFGVSFSPLTPDTVVAYSPGGIDKIFGFTNNPFDYPIWEIGSNVPDVPVDGDFQGLDDVDVTQLDVISSDLPDEDDPEVRLPFPGLDVSDDSISSDTYDDIIGAINDGTISINDGIDDIIGRLRVISYDIESGDVIPPRPDPDDPTENVKKDDVVNDNKNNMGFTLAGLEGVFPFCIPWDIYAFMTLLVADPVAPEFDFPIKSVNNQIEEIHVDLTPFEPVAVVVRYIFDFLFIIGLAMLTRALIGGGSSD